MFLYVLCVCVFQMVGEIEETECVPRSEGCLLKSPASGL